MTNPFITIWVVIKNWIIGVNAKTWQVIAVMIGLTSTSILFYCIHQINSVELSFRIEDLLAGCHDTYSSPGSSELSISINNGLIFESDSIGKNETKLIPPLYSNNNCTRTIHVQPGDVVFPDSICNQPTSAFRRTKSITQYRRTSKYRIKTTPDVLRFGEAGWFVRKNTYSKKKGSDFSFNKFTTYDTAYYVLNDKVQQGTLIETWGLNSFNNYPRLWDTWDISQRTYRLNFTTRCTQISNDKWKYIDNIIMPLKHLSVDFMGPVELSQMNPSPDIQTYSGFEFSDSLKLRQIMNKGLVFHAKFPQTESLQSARIFFLSTFLSLFFTLFFTLIYRILRMKYIKRGRNTNQSQ